MSLQLNPRGHPKAGDDEVATKAPGLDLSWAGLGVAKIKEAMHWAKVDGTLCPGAGGGEDVEGESGEDVLNHGCLG